MQKIPYPSHVRVEEVGLVLVTKMKPGRRWVLVAQLWYPGKKGQVHWYLHTMKEFRKLRR